MIDRDKEDKKNKRIGWITSVSIQLILLVLFYFIIAWKAPFPPIPEYGIELGFETSSGAPKATPAPAQPPVEDTSEESNSQDQEVAEPEAEVPVEQEQSVEETAVQEVADVTTSDNPAPQADDVPEKPSETTPVEDPTPATPTAQESEQVAPEEVKTGDESGESETEAVEEAPKIDQRAIYGSQGTQTGSNEGASLALAGWVWDFKPKPEDDSSEEGKIVYRIVVDEEGYLVKIATLTSTVSPAVERKYRQAVEKLTFSKTSEYQSAPLSTGTLTFIITTR